MLEEQEKEIKIKQIAREAENLFSKYRDLISTFLEVAERKVGLLDDYGEENREALPKEINVMLEKIAKREGLTDEEIQKWKKNDFYIPEVYEKLKSSLANAFMEYHKKEASRPATQRDYSNMDGIDFESFLIKLLKENSFVEVRGTPATGDQGADLIAKKDGKTIVIQAKRYKTAVGNKAVQEVASAVQFYNGDEGWVITNSQFTKAAKELAQRTGVRLIDGRDLARFSELFA